MFLVALAACTDYTVTKLESAPLSLSITSPSYGAFLGDAEVVVTGVVSPADAAVKVNDQLVYADADGNFSVTLPWTDRAMIVYARATRGGEIVKQYVPVFDGIDPRAYDPGAMRGLLTPSGLDALEPVVADTIDALGWEDQILAALPGLDTDYVDITASSVVSDGAVVDLSPGETAVTADIGFANTELTADISVLDGTYVLPVTISIGTMSIAADAAPTLADDMLSLSLSNLVLTIDDIGMDFGGLELPDWLTEIILDPIAELVATLGTYLGDYLLDSFGTFELGGPFAFDFDLMGTQLSTKLAEVGASPDGVGLGLTVGYDESAPDVVPTDLAALGTTTPSGLDYQLGLAVHEGMLNVVMDELLAGFLDIEMDLEGDYAELMGAGFTALPGGDQMPEHEGFCLAIHTGEARVVRMVEGRGAPMARALLPDLRVTLDVMQEGACNPWLDAVLFASVDLHLDGTAVSAELSVPSAVILDYRAEGVDEKEVAQELGDVVGGLAGLLAGSLSFDLGEGIDLGGITLDPEIVSIEALDETGLYGVYMETF